MNEQIDQSQVRDQFLLKSALIINLVVAIILTPFTINHFTQGRYSLALIILLTVILCTINVWNCAHNRYQPLVIFFSLIPSITISLVYTLYGLGVAGMLWSYPSVLLCYFMLPERYAWVANTAILSLLAFVAWDIFEPQITIRFIVTLFMTNVLAGIFTRLITKQQVKLEEIAVTDSLTGLFNRVQLNNNLEKAHQQNHRTGSPMALLMIDVDHFKEVNDVFGHHVGDNVLRGIGEYFKKRIRGSDTIFRVGGEEFLALLYDTNLSNACLVAEEIRKDIESLLLIPEQAITVSIGAAEFQQKDDSNSWMKRADDNLYLAKSNGRNKIVS